MAVISTSNHPAELWPGVMSWFGLSYNEKGQQWNRVFDVRNSEKAYEELVESTSFGLAPIKTQGASVTYDTHSQQSTTRLTHITYALGFIVTWEERRDNQYAELANSRARSLGFSMRQTKEMVAGNVLNRAFDTNYTGGDGKALCVTDHPSNSGNQSNALSPAADISEAALETLLIQVRNAKNNRGLKIQVVPQMLIVAPEGMFDAERIVNSNLRPGTADNDLNAIRRVNAFPDGVFVYDYLTTQDDFFIKTDVQDGLVGLQREKYAFDQDNDFDTKNAKASGIERYVFGWGDWRTIFGSAGA